MVDAPLIGGKVEKINLKGTGRHKAAFIQNRGAMERSRNFYKAITKFPTKMTVRNTGPSLTSLTISLSPQTGQGSGGWNISGATPPVDANKEKKPNNIYKMPIPSSRLETDVGFCREMAFLGSEITDE